MKYIDTHCHLFLPREAYAKWGYSTKTPEVILKRAKEEGVEKLILIGTDAEDNPKNLEFASNNENVFCAVGYHPSEIPEKLEQKYILDNIRELLNNKKVVAIGEVGLDISHGGDLDSQKEFLIKIIDLAIEFKKPIILHIKDEWETAQKLLKPYKNKIKVVFHCFTGDLDIAKNLINDGWMLSFTNIISYPKNESLREVVEYIPIEKIMIETDSPFLPPQSRRGTICEPSDVVFVAEEIARIKKINIDEVARITTENAQKFFNI